MKKYLAILFFLLATTTLPVQANPQKDYQNSYLLSVAAAASSAAYSGPIGEMAARYLEENGWEITYYRQSPQDQGARFLVARKYTDQTSAPSLVIAIVGTETKYDIKADLSVDKISFGSPQQESAAGAEPKVHKGFYRFTRSALAATPQDSNQSVDDLLSLLQNRPQTRICLTGHSLGGAAAILAGVHLLDLGIQPDRITVITFGSPAVGNQAFVDKYAPLLHLTRVVIAGDPVIEALQALVGGYRQFGQVIRAQSSMTDEDPHKLASYWDWALKQHYDQRRLAETAGLTLPKPSVVKPHNQDPVCVLPLQNNLPKELIPEGNYMRQVMRVQYEKYLPQAQLPLLVHPQLWQSTAVAAKTPWALVPEVSAHRINQGNHYYVALTQTLYHTETGQVISWQSLSATTRQFTPLEACIQASQQMNLEQADWPKWQKSFPPSATNRPLFKPRPVASRTA